MKKNKSCHYCFFAKKIHEAHNTVICAYKNNSEVQMIKDCAAQELTAEGWKENARIAAINNDDRTENFSLQQYAKFKRK